MPQPLQGLLVVDLTRVLAGPWCTMVLRSLGAEVIKVEMPVIGDDARHYGPFLDPLGQTSAYFTSVNSGKRSLALDLKASEGRGILLDLVARADVLVENFSPGTMARLGFPTDEIARCNPGLVYASISGYGQSGPGSQRPAYDIIVQALSGLMSITGTEDGSCARVGSSISDIVAGIYTALGIVAALLRRERTHVGARLDIAMLDSTVAILENAIIRHQVSGEPLRPLGARHSSITPFDTFPTADSTVVVAAGNDRLFATLCTALGRPELALDPRYRTNALRTANAQALKQEISVILRERPSEQWLELLAEHGIPAACLRTISEVIEDAQLRHRRMLLPIAGSDLEVVASPIKFAGEPEATELPPAPALGEHSAALLQRLLGYSEERIAQLVAAGVVAIPPKSGP